jgi:TolB-like protein
MGTDEAGTMSALRAVRKELWGPKIEEFGGRIVKLTGDGQLTEFPRVADAVHCAVEVQRAMRRRNAEIPEDHRITLRIGINQGDVIVDGDDIYGDGVNVAARLEGIAEPGGICISRAVRDQIRDKLLYELEDLGEQELKNIARPVRAFRVSIEETGDTVGARASAPPVRPAAVSPPARPAAPTNRLWQGIAGAAVVAALVAIYVVTIWQPWVTRVEAANVANMAFPLPDKPSLVVLPFENLSGDPAQDFLVDGLSEDITTALARLPSIFVMSRNSAMTYKGRAVKVQEVAEDLGVQYVLEGSVQRDGDRLRVNAQLIDALSGRHVWADRFDRDVTDLFAVKDEITLRIATNISSELGAELRDRPQYRGTDNLEAWLLYRQARALWDEFTPEANLRMRNLFLRAMELDPDYSGPIAQMATAYWQAASFGFTDDPVGALEIAAEFAERALSVNPSEPQGYVALATLHLAAQNVDAALEAATKVFSAGY